MSVENKNLGVGIIGCGNIVAAGHKPALETLDNVEVVALMDVTEERLKLGQEWFGLHDDQLHNDHRSLIDREDVDIVLVTVPQQFRNDIVIYAIANGKHILSEKPIATTPLEATRFAAAAEEASVIFGMVHNYLYFPEYILIKSLIERNEIGDVRVLTMNYLGVIDNPGVREYESDWRHKMSAGGGVLMDMIHAVYLAEWLIDDKAQQVNAFVDAPTYQQRNPEIEDLILMQIAFPSSYAQINMGWGQGVGGVDVSGTHGQIRMRYHDYQTSGFNRPAELYSVTDWKRTDHALHIESDYQSHLTASFTGIWHDFCDAVRNQRNPIATADHGRRALEIALAGYLSGSTGRTVTLPLPAEHPVFLDGVFGLKKTEIWSQSKAVKSQIFDLGTVADAG